MNEQKNLLCKPSNYTKFIENEEDILKIDNFILNELDFSIKESEVRTVIKNRKPNKAV